MTSELRADTDAETDAGTDADDGTDIGGGICCAPLRRAPLAERDAADLAEILKAIADPVRLRLVSIIATAETGEVCACDLPSLVERSQPTVSHHLSLLVKAGIVEREQRGKWAWFRLRPERLAALADVLTAPA